MREGIHPKYNAAKVICACGNVIETRSTRGDFHIEICSNCHPFFTGKQKILDTAGRIERFKTRYAAAPAKLEAKPVPAAKTTTATKAEPAQAEAKENRAAKRAKANAGKPKVKPAKAEAPEAEAAAGEGGESTPTA